MTTLAHLLPPLSARWTRRRLREVPERGEVWLVDFGITQKVRPALVISVPYAAADRALLGVIPHTTATRGSLFEVSISARFLSEGAFLVQGIQAVPPKYFVRQLGTLSPEQLQQVSDILLSWLGLRAPNRTL
jgi:mRNA interferase MazF